MKQYGFPVGVDTYLRVERLLNSLDADTDSYERMRSLMCPLFATSPQEQEKFYRLYEHYFRNVAGRQEVEQEEVTPAPKRKKRKITVTKIRRRYIILAIVVSILMTFLTGRSIEGYRTAKKYLPTVGLSPSFQNLSDCIFRYVFFQKLPCEELADLRFQYRLVEEASDSSQVQFVFYDTATQETRTRIWRFGDGTTEESTADSIIHTYKSIQNFNICLEVRNERGCVSYPTCQTLRLLQSQNCNAQLSVELSGMDANFRPYTSPKLLRRWRLEFGDGDSLTGEGELESAYMHSYAQADTYQSYLYIWSDGDCKDVDSNLIIIDPIDTAAVASDPDLIAKTLVPLPHKPPLTQVDKRPEISIWKRILPWMNLLLIFLLVFGFGGWELYKRNRRQIFLSKERNVEAPMKWSIEIKENEELSIFDPNLLRKATTNLRQRQEGESEIIDIPQTISATLEAGGYPSLRYEKSQRPSEYLILIDRFSDKDHQAKFFEHLAKKLGREDIYVDIYYYKSSLDLFWRKLEERPIYLNELQIRHPNHRLLIMGDGEQLIDAVSGDLKMKYFDFLEWEDRAILTPLRSADWGYQELALIQNFLLMPATAKSLVRLVEEFESDEWPTFRQQINREETPKDDWQDEDEPKLDELREFLGVEGFEWVAACAIYPELQWNLTLEIGKIISEKHHPRVRSDENDYTLLNEDVLLRMIRVPYFRIGSIPDELRLKLIDLLDKNLIHLVRKRVVDLLRENPPPPGSYASDQCEKNLVLQEWELHADDRQKRRELDTRVEEFLARDEIDDVVVMKDIKKHKRTPLEFAIPESFRKRLFKDGISLLGIRSGIKLLVLIPFVLLMLSNRADISNAHIETDRRGNRYILTDRSDSLTYYEWEGLDYYLHGDSSAERMTFYGQVNPQYFVKAARSFSQAISLDPNGARHYYHRGLARLAALRAGQILRSDSTYELIQTDFASALRLEPLFQADSTEILRKRDFADLLQRGPLTNQKRELSYAELSSDGKRFMFTAGKYTALYQSDAAATEAATSYFTDKKSGSSVRAASFSPNPALLATASADGSVSIWAAKGTSANAAPLRTFMHATAVNQLAFAPNKAILATATKSGLASLWNVQTGEVLHILEGHRAAVEDVAFSRTGMMMVTASDDSTAIVWDVDAGTALLTIGKPQAPNRHKGAVVSARFSPDGNYILTASVDRTARVWNLEGEQTLQIDAGLGPLSQAIFSPDGSMIVTVGEKEQIKIWDVSGNLLFDLSLDISSSYNDNQKIVPRIVSASFSEDASRLLIATNTGKIQIIEFDPKSFHHSRLKRYAHTNQAVVHYERRKLEDALHSFLELHQLPQKDADVLFGSAICYFYLGNDFLKTNADSLATLHLQEIRKIQDSSYFERSTNARLLLSLLDSVRLRNTNEELQATLCDIQESISPNYCNIQKKYDELGEEGEGWIAVRKGELWGYLNDDRELAIDLQYQEAKPFQNDRALVRQNNQYRFIYKDNTTAYDQLGVLAKNRMIAVKKHGRWGYVYTRDNTERIPREYMQAWTFKNGVALVKGTNNKLGLINARQDSMEGGIIYTMGDMRGNMMWLVAPNDTFRLDTTNNTIYRDGNNPFPHSYDIPPQSETVIRLNPDRDDTKMDVPFEEPINLKSSVEIGQGNLKSRSSNNKYAIFSANYEQLTDYEYTHVLTYSEGRVAVQKDGKWRFLNLRGDQAFDGVFDAVPGNYFQNGEVLVRKNGNEFYINVYGRCVPKKGYECGSNQRKEDLNQQYNDVIDAGDGYFWVKKARYYTLVNRYNEVLIGESANYTEAWPFRQGLAAVAKIVGSEPLYGFIDRTGEERVPFLYSRADTFRTNGLARVMRAGVTHYINKSGECQVVKGYNCPLSDSKEIEQSGYETSELSEEGIADKKSGLMWFRDVSGKTGLRSEQGVLLKAVYDNENGIFFKDGLARVRVREKMGYRFGYINTEGEEVISAEYEAMDNFYDGLARVKRNGKWGYLNQEGEEVIPIVFDEAQPYMGQKYIKVSQGEREYRYAANGDCLSKGCP